MRKIVLLISIVFVFGCITCYASETTVISLNENVVDDEISVNIDISENSISCGGKLDIVYDNTVLNASSYEVGELLSGYNCFVNLKYKDDTIRLSWAGISELIQSGTLCTINFTKKSDKNFSTEIGIGYSKLAKADGNPILVEVKDCVVSYISVSTQASGHSSSRVSSNKNNEKILNEENTIPNSLANLFVDVKTDDWFYENVKYVVENKLMNGVSETSFVPNGNVTRAMLVTVLYRNEGKPSVNKDIPFADIDMGAYYANAVIWAKQNAIINGVTENKFAPNTNITREQIAAIMHRYAQYKGYDVDVETNIFIYDDAQSISEYAIDSMRYAVGSGLIKGRTATTVNPQDNATRAEIATMLQRLIDINK